MSKTRKGAYDDGQVVYVEGVHYPVGEDAHADLSRPLRWENGGYRDAEAGEPTHEETYHTNHLELDFGGEQIEIAADEADAVKAFLADRRSES